MTDRIHGLIVSLERDLRTDDCETIIQAIKSLRFVSDVKPLVVEPGDYLARDRVMAELRQKLFDVLK